ncbi:hypothetical protein NC653_026318 [Populus alba x Populus x berolinensis]|uniref:Uncharacterized protein n=1 Tax=Populus alba x Populus x berolinensis TaxID=444605 RepID=A0AAD6MDR6_9ROSI|nr:hypothetical protein NC653_026318 [Populus alba x Populus x berolinensis]
MMTVSSMSAALRHQLNTRFPPC